MSEKTTFAQYDVYLNVYPDNPIFEGDRDHQAVWVKEASDPVTGSGGVRVLIRDDVSRHEAVLALLKVAQAIEQNGC